MVKALIVFSLALLFCSCSLLVGEDQPLTENLSTNNSRMLRLDGYYIDSPSSAQDRNARPLILYQNGIVLKPFAHDRDSLDAFHDYLRSVQLTRSMAKTRYVWGHYWIQNDTLLIESWSLGGGFYSDVFIEKATILNDSTFRIETIESPDGSLKVRSGELYRFKKFSPKPDSICPFIPESDPNYKPPDK
jgi:hypothetical protein